MLLCGYTCMHDGHGINICMHHMFHECTFLFTWRINSYMTLSLCVRYLLYLNFSVNLFPCKWSWASYVFTKVFYFQGMFYDTSEIQFKSVFASMAEHDESHKK